MKNTFEGVQFLVKLQIVDFSLIKLLLRHFLKDFEHRFNLILCRTAVLKNTYFSIKISTASSHFVKSICIWSYFSPHFFRIWTEYGEILRISPYSVRMREISGKMRTRITPNTDTFYARFFFSEKLKVRNVI